MPKLALIGLVAAVAGSSPQVVARIPTGTAPGGAVSGFGAIWVTNDGSGTLVRIDPRTNRVTRRIRLRPGVFSVTRGFGALWTVNYKRHSLTRVNPASGRPRSIRLSGEPSDVLAAFGRVWVTTWTGGRLLAIDPRSMRIVKRIRIGARAAGMRAATGAVWVGFGRGSTAVARVDPRTAEIVRVPVGAEAPRSFTRGTGDLWAQAGDNVLVRIDPSKRAVTAKLSFGGTLSAGALGPDGTIWVPDKEQNVVYRVDPGKAAVVDSFAAGPGAFVALHAFGSMWVTSYAGHDVWRFESSSP
jgi:streptogramin lyase